MYVTYMFGNSSSTFGVQTYVDVFLILYMEILLDNDIRMVLSIDSEWLFVNKYLIVDIVKAQKKK